MSHIDLRSGLNAAALAILVVAASPEEFVILECTDTLEAAGMAGIHRWGLILPNSSRVSVLTYKSIVAVRYPELVLQNNRQIQIGHFVAHENTVDHGGFRAIFSEPPKDLRAAVDDLVVILNYLRRKHRGFTAKGPLVSSWCFAALRQFMISYSNTDSILHGKEAYVSPRSLQLLGLLPVLL